MIPGIAEYIDINVDTDYYHLIFEKVSNIEFNTFAIKHFNRNRDFTGSNDNNQF